MLYSTNLSYTYQHTDTSSQTTGLAAMQHPWRNLEFSALFKGTLELFREEPPFAAEYVALSQTFLQKGWSRVLAVSAVTQGLFVIQCLVQGHFNRQTPTGHTMPRRVHTQLLRL